MSVENIITENLDIWTSAIKAKSASGRGTSNKLELYGIKKLRELILELAVRGKLVPQNSGDETASTLLKKIEIEKNRLIKTKSIKASKIQGSITEIPFEVPKNWEWCFLYDLGRIVGGGTPKSGEPSYWCDDGVKWLTPADLYGLKDKYIGCGKRDISPLGLEKSSAQLLPKGSVLFSSRAPIGYVAIASKELATNQGFKSVVPYNIDCSDYIYYFLKRSAAEIDGKASGTTFKEVSGAIVSKILVPLPPLNEQNRIVKRVDELMALCDQLESQTEASIEAHQTLVRSLLETLTNAKDADELNESWQRISAHFDVLFTTEDSIDQLKQTILQLAVMGKLVKQDPNDEPASKLLERIEAEKEQLIKDKKIKNQKKLPDVNLTEKRFKIPNSWVWTRFGNVTNSRLGKMLDKSKNIGNPLPYLRNTNVQWGRFELDDLKLMRFEDSELEEFKLSKGDLLICEGGEPGRCAIWDNEIDEMYFQKALHRVRTYTDIAPEYLKICLTVDCSNGVMQAYFTGATIKHLVGAKLNSYVIPIPPLKEQIRIIERVSTLFELCDNLSSQIKILHLCQIRLSEAQYSALV